MDAHAGDAAVGVDGCDLVLSCGATGAGGDADGAENETYGVTVKGSRTIAYGQEVEGLGNLGMARKLRVE